jgi:ribosome biogenesis SPOUT family RNA methylase Rps3
MEEDENTPKALPDWVELEYKVGDILQRCKQQFQSLIIQHMRNLAGPSSEVHFTHLSQACSHALLESFRGSSAGTNADDIADVFCTTQGVLDLIMAIGLSLDQVCLLDPKAERELSPDDKYTNFLFGVGVDMFSHLRHANVHQGDFGWATTYIVNTVPGSYILQEMTHLVIVRPSFEC